MKRGVLRPSLTSWVCIFLSPYLLSTFAFHLHTYLPIAETSEGPEIAAGVGMIAPVALIAPIPVAPSVPVPAVPTTPVSSVPAVPVSATPVAPIPGNFGNFFFLHVFSSHAFFFIFLFCLAFPSSFFLGPLPTIPSQFEVGSSSATVLDDVASFFVRFD